MRADDIPGGLRIYYTYEPLSELQAKLPITDFSRTTDYFRLARYSSPIAIFMG
jgi:hypothetical protein